MDIAMRAALARCVRILEINSTPHDASLTTVPLFICINRFDVYPVLLAFLVGFITSNWIAGNLWSGHVFQSWMPLRSLRNLESWVLRCTSKATRPTTVFLVDHATQTLSDAPDHGPQQTSRVEQDKSISQQEEDVLADTSAKSSDDTPNVDIQEPEIGADGYQAIELEDLDDLEGQIYDGGHKHVLPSSAVELISEDPLLTSMISVLLNIFGDLVPETCTPSKSGTEITESDEDLLTDITESDEELLKKSGRSRFPRRAYTNGDITRSRAERDRLEMEARLKYLICRYAAGNGRMSLLSKYMDGIPHTEYFGFYKLAIDKGDLSILQLLLRRCELMELDPKYDLPAVLEYAALRGRLDMMEELLNVGVNVEGTKTTNPLSAAIAGGSIDAVKVLVEWGATWSKNRKSIVKEYNQNPLVIAARHGDVPMIKYFIGADIPGTEVHAGDDALSIAVIDGRADMITCLMSGGITFTNSGPPIERALEIAVSRGDAELTELLLEAGADPNAKEYYLYDDSWYAAISLYGTIFQWACCTSKENVVRAFLEHGVDFDKPIQSWINQYYDKPIYVAHSRERPEIVQLILEYFDEADLVQFACSAVQKGQWFMFEHCLEFEAVKAQSSWLLKKCLAKLHELSEKDRYPNLANTGFVPIIHALVEAGAWLPPDTTWHLSSKVLFWLGYMSLDEFLDAVTSGENMQTEIGAQVMHRLSCKSTAQPWIEYAPYYSLSETDR